MRNYTKRLLARWDDRRMRREISFVRREMRALGFPIGYMSGEKVRHFCTSVWFASRHTTLTLKEACFAWAQLISAGGGAVPFDQVLAPFRFRTRGQSESGGKRTTNTT